MVDLVRIRPLEAADALRLYDVFHSSIHTHAVLEHSREQLCAWAPATLDVALTARWIERMHRIRPFVVEVDDGDEAAIAAYGDVQPDGYIDHFFVAGASVVAASVHG